MPTSALDVLLAATPPLLVLILMVGFRWGGPKAGLAGWLAALIIAVLRFGAGGDVLLYAHARAVIRTLDVVYIVWAALLLYLVVDNAGALQVIADWFTNLTGDEVLRVLLLGWVFTSFLQGVGGFGVPVAIVAPLLVGLGLSPLAAVVVPSIGHGWAVTFGSLGSSFLILLSQTGVDPNIVAPATAVLLGIGGVASGVLVAQVYAGWSGVRRALPAVLVLGVIMAVVQYLLATNNLWNIAAAGGGLAGLAVGIWVARWSIYQRRKPAPEAEEAAPAEAPAADEKPKSDRPIPTFAMAIVGYAILVVLAVLISGIPDVKHFFGQVKLGVSIPEIQTSLGWTTPAESNLGIAIFSHTGAILLYSAVITYFLYRRRGFYRPGVVPVILKGVWKKGEKAALGILLMVAMATVMDNAGMVHTLAVWLAGAVPSSLYAFVSAVIGSLGAFMTGSNTNSNAVFATLQMNTATLLGLSVPLILATQTASAAIASVLAPAKIIVGASTVGMSGDEGRILRNLVAYGGALLLLIAVLAFIFLQLGF